MSITNLKKYVNFDLLYCINASYEKPKKNCNISRLTKKKLKIKTNLKIIYWKTIYQLFCNLLSYLNCYHDAACRSCFMILFHVGF